MKIKIIAIVTILLFLAVPVGFAAEKVAQEKVFDVGNKKCPVSGDPVTPGVTSVYKGKLYHFCCTACLPEFEKNPEKYITKMNKARQKAIAAHAHA